MLAPTSVFRQFRGGVKTPPSRPLPTEQKEKSASKETCPGEINPAPCAQEAKLNNGKAAGRALGGAQRAPPVCKQTRSCGCLLHAHNPAMPGPYASVCLNAFHSSLFSGAHHAPNSKAVSTTKGRPCGKNQSRRDQPPGRGAKRRRQQHHRAPMAAHLRIRGCRRPCTPGKVPPPYCRGKGGRRGGVPRGLLAFVSSASLPLWPSRPAGRFG